MPTENRSSNTEMVSVPRHTLENVLNDGSCKAEVHAAFIQARNDIERLLAQPAQQHQGEPVAYFWRHDAEHEHGIARNYQELSREKPDLQSEWLSNVHEIIPLYTHADPGEVERLRLLVSAGQEIEDHLSKQVDIANITIITLRAQLAERDALLQRALPFLSNTPDLVQHGAEDLAQEIRSASAGKPCYGPNEWGTECGQCSKCESASAEPSAPVEHDEQAKFKTHFADYLSGANKLGTDYNNLVARGMEIGWMARAGVPGKPSRP